MFRIQILKFGREMFLKYIIKYVSQSSTHCWRYLVDRKLSIYERVLWIFFIIAAIFGVVVINYATLLKYTESPIVISIDKDHYYWNTTFPSITVCPLSKINKSLLDDYVSSSTAENKTLLREFLISLAYADYTNLDKIPQYQEIPGEKYTQLLMAIQNDFVPSVSSTGLTNFRYTVHRVVTEMGICYSLNSKLAIYSSAE